MKTRKTWSGTKTFSYSGTVPTGTLIQYGNGSKADVSPEQFAALLSHFRKQEVSIGIGTSRTSPPKGSVGEWLMQNVTVIAIASYVGRILISEGYATRGAQSDRIKFL